MKYDIKSIEKRKKIAKNIKNILYVILIILIYNMVLIGVSSTNKLKNINLFGYKSYVITSASMEPEIKSGDVIISKVTKQQDLQKGDVITFKKNQDVITHRIVDIQNNEEKKYYVTKGDNNKYEDLEKIEYGQIEGKYIFKISKLGKFIILLDNKIVILIIMLVILILCIMKIQKDEKKEIRREKKIESKKENKD